MYKIMLGMSYYIHGRGLGALIDGVRPDFKGVARSAVNVLLGEPGIFTFECIDASRLPHRSAMDPPDPNRWPDRY